MKYAIAGITHQGKVRPVNEDRLLMRIGDSGGAPEALLAVADGMGGLACGERASALAVENLAAWWQDRGPAATLEERSRQLDRVLYKAHRDIFYLGEELRSQTGSTLSLLYLHADACLIKQIGDSRVYALDDGGVRQLTTDQTWCNRMTAAGELTPEQASRHRLRHALVNALGVSPELEIATQTGAARRGTQYLLCSDGFYAEAPLHRLQQDLRSLPADQALQALLQAVLAGPAADNATAILCRLV